MTSVLIRERRRFDTQRHRRKGHVKAESEIGVMHLQAKECQELLQPSAARREAWNRFFLTALRSNFVDTLIWDF